MRRMIDLGRGQRGPFHNIIDTPTSLDCGVSVGVSRDVRFRRTFRTLVDCMFPACCAFSHEYLYDDTFSTAHSTVVTGTIFGHRNGRVTFCIQDGTRVSPPLLLLEFSVPTSYLARQMHHGLLRIALDYCPDPRRRSSAAPLYDVPVWCMYCNGRKVGFAVRRQMNPAHAAVLKLMQSISAGAGVLPRAEDGGGELMYLRASFERVIGSADSESFHMINPAGSSAQELSVFLLRS
ncbi:hypothetical protein ABFS82_03G001800 [Erythranthe guttata]|uniref:Protein MIZU-KUSSEI 1 n=1 Tax=Erythranthe guttata TaxID=4155 RepID=A0A022RQK4_ERYGU|nr:PREDICTED: protein MIZU-KUSSEI 1 [Erythranthe guttata]EYU41220.1 hypothetical protein MIMGU_mgv1a021556mg [Erythranthe guttata]|eukprot:XP_012832773.1 PREDICTED: protein MIZU-KUSSEI 1 [Erythranthe guttata]